MKLWIVSYRVPAHHRARTVLSHNYVVLAETGEEAIDNLKEERADSYTYAWRVRSYGDRAIFRGVDSLVLSEEDRKEREKVMARHAEMSARRAKKLVKA